MGQTTQNQRLKRSDEINEEQIKLAKRQGEVFQEAIQIMTQKDAHGTQRAEGDYIIAWVSEKAEGMYIMRNGQLEWDEPQIENTHLELAVCSLADGRFVPNLTVYATLIDQKGDKIGMHQQPFLWHPWLYHYGRNWHVPDEGPYTLSVRVEVPFFPSHDKTNGKLFDEPVEVEFSNVKLAIGQK